MLLRAAGRRRSARLRDAGDSAGVAIDSIAILPFANGDQNPDTDYLADGISEGISNNLSQIQSLRVMAQDSVRRYKGRPMEARAVGKELGVRAVLTGAISSRGEAFRIQAELVDVRTGAQLWGQQLTRRQGEVLELQDEIAKHISGRLELKLSGEERKQVARRDTADQGAYQRYLKGRYHWNERTTEGYRKAIEFFREAIELDPSYARAYVGLADAHAFLPVEGLPARDRYDKAIGIVKKALEIDDTLGEAHASMGLLLQDRDWDLPGAEREYRRALELSPNYGSAHHWYGELLVQTGRFDEALEHYRRALEVDPLSSAIASDLGISLFYARRYDEAIAELRKVVQADPKFSRTHHYLARVYAQVGRYREAIDEHQKGWLSAGDDARRGRATGRRHPGGAGAFGRPRLLAGAARARAAEDASAERWEHDVAHAPRPPRREGPGVRLARKGLCRPGVRAALPQGRPEWDGLRGDPRFQDLVRRIDATEGPVSGAGPRP